MWCPRTYSMLPIVTALCILLINIHNSKAMDDLDSDLDKNEHKRAPSLSINQDSQLLADAMRGKGSTSSLYRLGKRGRSLSINQDSQILADALRGRGGTSSLYRLGKRAPSLSINQDSQLLADALRGRGGTSSLYRLGKRAPSLSINQDSQLLADALRGRGGTSSLYRLGKRAPSLSINQDSQLLADALRGRGGTSSLYRLGKRAPSLSINQDSQLLADALRGRGGTSSLYRLGKRAPSLSINQDSQILADSLRHSNDGSSLYRLGKREHHPMSVTDILHMMQLADHQYTDSDSSRDYIEHMGNHAPFEDSLADENRYRSKRTAPYSGIEENKRRPLSVNADLMAIANSLHDNANTGESYGNLMRLGKRVPELSFNQDLKALTRSAYARRMSDPLASRFGKRAPSLSFNQDLHSIANSYREGQGNKQRNLLNRLGKRSIESDVEKTSEDN